MRSISFTVAALITLAATSQVLAQQTSAQVDQSNATTERQTTSATWTTSSSPPEQAGDLYQARTRANGDYGSAATRDDPLPGALNPGLEPSGGARPSDPKE